MCVCAAEGGGARRGLCCFTSAISSPSDRVGSFHCLCLDLFTPKMAWLVTSTSLASARWRTLTFETPPLGGWS